MSDATRSVLHEVMVRRSCRDPNRANCRTKGTTNCLNSKGRDYNYPQRSYICSCRRQSRGFQVRRQPADHPQHRPTANTHLPLRPTLPRARRSERDHRPQARAAPRRALHRRQPRNRRRRHSGTHLTYMLISTCLTDTLVFPSLAFRPAIRIHQLRPLTRAPGNHRGSLTRTRTVVREATQRRRRPTRVVPREAHHRDDATARVDDPPLRGARTYASLHSRGAARRAGGIPSHARRDSHVRA